MPDQDDTRLGADALDRIVGKSDAMRQVKRLLVKVAASDATIMLFGESGTGKELVARAIHEGSARRQRKFVAMNCAALPETLLESELFGHEKGAFTGAGDLKKGRFELADGGTLFLDEVADLSPVTQPKILRVLQEGEFERVGATETIRVNVRLVAATNQDLAQMVRDKRFREDLYYRLYVVPIELKPLRERTADIPLLAEHFLRKYASENRKDMTGIAGKAMMLLRAYHWPGNVRELENAIERAVVMCSGNTIDVEDLPDGLMPPRPMQPTQPSATRASRRDPLGLQIPRLIAFVLHVKEGAQSIRGKKQLFDWAGQQCDWFHHSVIYDGRIKKLLAEWSILDNRTSKFGPATTPSGVAPEQYSYQTFIKEFESLLRTYDWLPAHAKQSVTIRPLPEVGALRLITALPSAERENHVDDLVRRTRESRKVWLFYDVDSVGEDSTDDQMRGRFSLCSLVARDLEEEARVTSRSLPRLVEQQGRPVLVLNGFAPCENHAAQWDELIRSLRVLRSKTSIWLVLAANPCHDPATVNGSTWIDFDVTRVPMPPSQTTAGRIFKELRPCCQRILRTGDVHAEDACVRELLSAGVLQNTQGRVEPPLPEWTNHWRSLGGGDG